MKDIKTRIKERFGYDVTALPEYVNEQSEDIYADLLYSSGLTSKINVLENVKGKQTIKLLNADLALKSGEGCLVDDNGTITFDGKDIETSRLRVQTSLCNDTLEDTWAQLLLSIGANQQDRDLPLQDVLTAYIIKATKKKNQDLMFNGVKDLSGGDLSWYDGFVTKWDADTDLIEVTTAETSITKANAFDIAIEVYEAIPTELFDNGVNVEIIMGRATANKVLAQIYNDKDYNALVNVTQEGSELSFVLPTTNITIRTYPQLNTVANQSKMFAVPYDYMFFGTDLSSDIDGLTVKYLEESEKLRIRNLFRSGVQYVYPEYFVKLALTV